MSPSPEPSTADLDTAYRRTLVRGLRSEAARWAELVPSVRVVAEETARSCERLESAASGSRWSADRSEYKQACGRLAAELVKSRPIAMWYDSMDEFWSDAARQASGESVQTFWDVYEHGGRRLLEHKLAAAYGAEDALLLNSGMSAIAVATETANLRSGESIIAAGSGYFETTDLVQRTLAARGVRIVAAEHATAQDIQVARAGIFEVACASPAEPQRLDDMARQLQDAGRTVVVDNSIWGPGATWGRHFSSPHAPVIAESTAKYLCEYVSGGVLYGSRSSIERARHIARSTGQQMQAAAFCYVRWGEIEAAALRMKLHARNVQLLLDGLRARERLALCITPAPNFTEWGSAAGAAPLVYLRAGPAATLRSGSIAAANRQLVSAWQAHAASAGHSVRVRAGYGWDATTVRCYEGAALKQSGVDDYIRISVGIEPVANVALLADALSCAIEETST